MERPVQYQGCLAEDYTSKRRTEHPHNSSCYETWLKEVGFQLKGKRILDMACGAGFSSRKLAELGASVHGIDISFEMIAQAREIEVLVYPLGITYQIADASQLDLERTFDIVTPSFLFNYAEDVAMLKSLTQSVARHLTPGGMMVGLNAPPQPVVPRMENAGHYSEWIDEPWKEGSRVRLRNFDLNGNSVCDIVFRYWSQETYEKYLTTAGLTNIRWVPVEMNQEGRKFPNWLELEQHMCSIVLVATKT